ncbi:MAG: UGSC family (seleno)protein [Candidatus Acidiferrales bacterium]|jgi:hypothetical protein
MKVNRRKLLSLIGMSPAVLAGAPAFAKPPSKSAAVVKTEPGKITALNPRGMPPSIQLIPMAPRLSGLDGKTIYLVSDGFPGADAFLNQIKVWFSKNMPGVTTEFRLKAGGFADDDPKLFAEMKQKAKGVIMAIGHCSTCTPATVGHCITFEKMGLPSAPIVTIAFKDLAKTNAAKRGMPDERICFTPHPVWGKNDAEMYAYLEGNDPVTGKPFMKEVIGALTTPLTADESKSGTITPPVGAPTFGPETSRNLQQYYLDNGMTDGLPIIIPTDDLVDEMLAGTSHKPDEVVGKMTPAQGAFPPWSYTVRQAAVNAVMAGATPDYFPIILAIASTGISALFSSTNSLVSAAVINGPIRDKLNMNYGIGAMGPFVQPNATIGRAWTLMSRNLDGGGIPGETYMGTQGNVVNYSNLIIPENEKDSPWTPFHVQKGFKPEENVISFFFGFGIQQGQGGRGLGLKPVPHFHEAMAHNVSPFASLFGTLILVDPLVAHGLGDLGFKTKDDIADWLQKNTTVTLRDVKSSLFSYAPRGPEAANLTDDSVFPKWAKSDAFNFVVVGGQTNPYHQIGNLSYRMSVSIDKWM